MYILCYEMPLKEVDNKIELLQINEIYDAFYESPLEITTDSNGYGYIEKEDDIVTLKVAFLGDEKDLEEFKIFISNIINKPLLNVYEENSSFDDFSIPTIELDNTWVLASPNEEIPNKKKINFISQGAFGTGLHETTQDLLRFILSKDFSNMKVLDIGTGSGILSIATSIKGADEVIALDIRDVQDEVLLNASLNNITNIKVLVGDALSNEVTIKETFDWIFINIGGDETKMFIPYINSHIKENGNLLVSGLVEWSFNNVNNFIEENGYTLIEKHQSNEWISSIYEKTKV